MQQRYATNPSQIPGMTTEQLRATFLLPEIFLPGEIRLTYTHHDRVVLGGAVPAGSPLPLPGYAEICSDYSLEHREVGIVWAMAGENQAFDDMDAVPIAELK